MLVVAYKGLISSVTFRKEDGFIVFENRVLWKLLGPKGEDITGNCFMLY